MAKLNQILAVVAGKKNEAHDASTAVYKKVQQSALFGGISKTYKPDDEEGTVYPPEKKNVQYTVTQALADFEEAVSDLWDVVATQEFANTEAKANIVVGNEENKQVLATGVPVSYLLFLEKQLTNVKNFVNRLPTLDPVETWSYDENVPGYKSEGTKTNKTKKVLKNHVKSEATDKHPAQVEVFSEDIKEGEWLTYKFSGAIPEGAKRELADRVRQLLDAVKTAREEANSIEVKQRKVAKNLFKFIVNG